MLVLLASTIAVAADNSTPQLGFTIGEKTVTVNGVDRGHQIILFGIGIGKHGWAALLTREVQTLRDDDRDGTVAFTVSELPARAVWVAVDFEDGAYVVMTPSGEPPAALVLPPDSWRGNREDLDIERAWLEALVVRRGVGAWTLRVADGGGNDADGVHNGVARLRLDRMERLIGEDKGPPFVVPRDLLVMIDPHVLDCFVSEAR